MNAMTTPPLALDNPRINIRLQLVALWTAAMFCYIYADILGLYDKWLLGEILKGNMGPIGPITQELKLGVAVLMSLPALMVLASVMLNPGASRWANIVCGTVKTIAILLTLILTFATVPWAYYVYFAVIEVFITSFIVWRAWTWPRSTP